MNGQGSPQSELRLCELKRRADGRKNQKRYGVQDEDGSQRDGHLFVAGLSDRTDGGNGSPAADRCAGGNEERWHSLHAQEPTEAHAREESEADAEQGVEETAASGP